MTEAAIIQMLPDKGTMLKGLFMFRLLSTKGTNGLGDYEVEYQFDPIGTNALKT